MCVACNHAVSLWCITGGDQYAFGVPDPANGKEQKEYRRIIILKYVNTRSPALLSQYECVCMCYNVNSYPVVASAWSDPEMSTLTPSQPRMY